MELSLPVRTLTPPPIRSTFDIITNLMDIIFKRSSDSLYLPTLFPSPKNLNYDQNTWVILFYSLKKVLDRADGLLPPELSGEIRASSLSTEAEAKFLRREIELNGTRVHFRSPKAESEADVGENKAECLERWMKVSRNWDAECRRSF